MTMTSNRRQFLGTLALSGAGAFAARAAEPAREATQTEKDAPPQPLVDSAPLLQCPSGGGVTVVWAVGRGAAGWIEYGAAPDRLDRTARGGRNGLLPYDERFLQIRLDGLEPGARTFYRTATVPFRYVSAYKFERGEPEYSEVYAFTTPKVGAASASFAVINDTHERQKTLKLLTDRLAAVKADYTVWNGDLVNSVNGADQVVAAIARPAGAPFAAERPLLLVPGNHDYRGEWARNLGRLLPEWPTPDPRDAATPRNFALRHGPLALIGLDTGEDKPDRRAEWAGLAAFEPYREAQRDWLARALARPEIASAPFVVAFCHIPLFDARPEANDGMSDTHYASYQGQGAKLWGPLLARHGVQLLVCGHMHRHRFDPATPERPWAQVVGGGPGDKDQVTVIRAEATAERLELAVDELHSGGELGRWTFAPRRV
jgi:predicted phosphodiesterase